MAEKLKKAEADAKAPDNDHNVVSKEEGDRISAILLANC